MHILVYGLSQDKLAGIETFLLNMNKFMPDDIIFDYVIEGTYTIHEKTIRQKGGNIHFIAPKRSFFKNILDWNKLLRKNKKQVKTVYFNMYSLAWFVPVCLARIYGYHVVIHAHNNNLHDCGKLQRALHAVNRQLQKIMKIVRLTNSELSTGFFFDNKPAEMIYCAIDVDRFAFNKDIRSQLRNELNIADKHVYGFVGRIEYQKNPLFLMEVFREIQKLDDKASFLVCGDGNLMNEVKDCAGKYGLAVCFAGVQPNVQNYYQAMDAFILPSRFEGLGIVLVEAQAAGLPCIASGQVIPEDSKVTELVRFIPLNENAAEWAEEAVKQIDAAENTRDVYADIVRATSFSIQTEAGHLLKFLDY